MKWLLAAAACIASLAGKSTNAVATAVNREAPRMADPIVSREQIRQQPYLHSLRFSLRDQFADYRHEIARNAHDGF